MGHRGEEVAAHCRQHQESEGEIVLAVHLGNRIALFLRDQLLEKWLIQLSSSSTSREGGVRGGDTARSGCSAGDES